MFPYQYIAIEGNIGAGKTTLCNMLSQDYGCKLILEQFDDNPFLPLFYQNPERYAFPVELFFMTERHKQLQNLLSQPSLFDKLQVADYCFLKTLLFAKNNLHDEEFRLFQRLFQVLNATFPKPELLVYLHRPVEVLLKQIAKRGRDYEKNISAEYLTEIQDAYFEYFKNEENYPIIIIELDDLNFVKNDITFKTLLNLMQRKYENGLHHIQLALELA